MSRGSGLRRARLPMTGARAAAEPGQLGVVRGDGHEEAFR